MASATFKKDVELRPLRASSLHRIPDDAFSIIIFYLSLHDLINLEKTSHNIKKSQSPLTQTEWDMAKNNSYLNREITALMQTGKLVNRLCPSSPYVSLSRLPSLVEQLFLLTKNAHFALIELREEKDELDSRAESKKHADIILAENQVGLIGARISKVTRCIVLSEQLLNRFGLYRVSSASRIADEAKALTTSLTFSKK